MSDKTLIERIDALAKKATPGPWLDGNWSGRCHKAHEHRGEHGADPCVYEYGLSSGGYIAVGTAEEKRMVLDQDYDGIILREEDRLLMIALRNAWPDIKATIERLQSELAEEKAARERAEHHANVLQVTKDQIDKAWDRSKADVASLRARVEAGEKALRELVRLNRSGNNRAYPERSTSFMVNVPLPLLERMDALLAEQGQEP